jgi:hypothetical protein
MEQDTKKWFGVERLFSQRLSLLHNPICNECDAKIRHPLLPWMIDRKFAETTERVLFVGKPHRGTPGKILPSDLIDPSDMLERLWSAHWPYWSYTREIAEHLYGSAAYDFIAFTNLVKCTNVNADDGESTSNDRTTPKMVESCVRRLGVLWREMEVVQPRTVIFYTYGLFRESLRQVPVATGNNMVQITPQDYRIECGRKKLGWWERSCRTSWTETLRLLVVGHPERMARRDFVRLLTSWIRPGTGTAA